MVPRAMDAPAPDIQKARGTSLADGPSWSSPAAVLLAAEDSGVFGTSSSVVAVGGASDACRVHWVP